MISFTFPPNKDGVSEAAAAVVSACRGMDWDVDVLTLPSTIARTSREWNGARIIEYEMNRSEKLTIDGVTQDSSVYFQSGKWDLLIFQAYDNLFRDALPILDRCPSRKILISHGYPGLVRYPMPGFPWGYPSMLRRFFRGFTMLRWLHKLDRVVYLSEHADWKGFYDHWLAIVSNYSGRRVIPNGINPGERGCNPDGFRNLYGIPRDAVLFLCVANYAPRKDQAYAARAFRLASIPNSRLVFIGSNINDHARKYMKDDLEAAKSGEENHVIWLENIDRQTTLDAFEASDAFVLSALHEAQPISLLEAMRAGKPWVARKSGCIHLMEGGICVSSEKAMAKAMGDLAYSPDLRSKLGQQGSLAVREKYNRDTYARSYVELVQQLFTE